MNTSCYWGLRLTLCYYVCLLLSHFGIPSVNSFYLLALKTDIFYQQALLSKSQACFKISPLRTKVVLCQICCSIILGKNSSDLTTYLEGVEKKLLIKFVTAGNLWLGWGLITSCFHVSLVHSLSVAPVFEQYFPLVPLLDVTPRIWTQTVM